MTFPIFHINKFFPKSSRKGSECTDDVILREHIYSVVKFFCCCGMNPPLFFSALRRTWAQSYLEVERKIRPFFFISAVVALLRVVKLTKTNRKPFLRVLRRLQNYSNYILTPSYVLLLAFCENGIEIHPAKAEKSPWKKNGSIFWWETHFVAFNSKTFLKKPLLSN